MKPWHVAVACLSLAGLAACGSKIELSECTAIPPATFSQADCEAHAPGAKCAVTQLRTTALADGGLSTMCHHENCEGQPTCPSVP